MSGYGGVDEETPDYVAHPQTTHMCPSRGSDVMPCCGLTPYQVPSEPLPTPNRGGTTT